MTIERPMFPPRAESVHAVPIIPLSDSRPTKGPQASLLTTLRAARRHMLTRLTLLPASAVAIPAAAAAHADAELIALGKQLEILVDANYAARQPWARSLAGARRVHDATFGDSVGPPGDNRNRCGI
jgi:hypothetical protein